MANQASTSMADSLEQRIKDCHNEMVIRLCDYFSPKLKDKWEVLLQRLTKYLKPVDLYADDNSFIKICKRLMALEIIDCGSYDKLYEVIRKIDAEAAKIIKKTSEGIKYIRSKEPSEVVQRKTRERDQTEEDDALGQSQPSQLIRPITANQKENILQYHTDMVTKLSGMFSLKSKEWSSIRSRIVMLEHLTVDDMGEVNNMFDLCIALKKKGNIDYGEYSKLRAVLVGCNVDAGSTIDVFTERIRRERGATQRRTDEDVGQEHSTGQPPAKQQRTDEGVGQQHSTEPMTKRQQQQQYAEGIAGTEEHPCNITITVVGHHGVGKSCLVRQLKREYIPEGGPGSTDTADFHVNFMGYNPDTGYREIMDKNGEIETGRQRLKRIIDRYRKDANNDKEKVSTSTPDLPTESTNAPTVEARVSSARKRTEVEVQDIGVPQEVELTQAQKHVIKEVMDTETEDKPDKEVKGYVTIYDFGGEKVFYNTHHCFMSSNMVFVLVFDVAMCLDPKREKDGYERIEFWLRNIATYAKDRAAHDKGTPPIILVGSHLDRVSTNKNEQRRLFGSVLEELSQKPELLEIMETHVQEMFPIADLNNSSINQDIYEQVWKKIISIAPLQSQWMKPVPARWVALEYELVRLKHEGRIILTYPDLLELNSKSAVPLEKDDVMEFLMKLRFSGSFLCFDIYSKSPFIILQPQWIIHAFKAITTAHASNLSPKQEVLWKRYEKSGVLSLDFIKQLWNRPVEGYRLLEEEERLFIIMETLGLLTKLISVDAEVDFIVPSMLQSADPEIISPVLAQPDTVTTITLCVVFDNPFIPQAVWDKMIACCIHRFQRLTELGHDGLTFIRRGFACLSVDYLWNMIICCNDNVMKVTMYKKDTDGHIPTGTGTNLLQVLEFLLQRVLELNDQSHLRYQFYLHNDYRFGAEEKMVKVDDLRQVSRLQCFGSNGKRWIDSDDISIWFGNPDQEKKGVRGHRRVGKMKGLPDRKLRTGEDVGQEHSTDAVKFIKAVKEDDLTVLREFEVLFKREVDFDQFPVNPLIILAAFGESTDAVELVHSWALATLNWNDQLEIPLGVFEGLFDDMKVRKATPLYVATFLKKTVIAESLIKYSDEHNIANCMSNIQLSNLMERVFIAEIVERLKQEYREWKPSVIPGYQKDANGKSVRVFIVYSTKVVHMTNNMKNGIGLVMLRNPYMVDDEAMTVSSKKVDIDIPKQDMERAKAAIDLHSKTLWCNHSNLNIISVCTVRSKRKGDILEKCLCIVLYCSTKGVVPLGENEFPSTLAFGGDDSIDIDVREGYFEFGGGYPTDLSNNHHETLKMGCNIGALSSQNGGGTLGPFVQYKGTMGFLTCAHVLFDIVHQYNVDFTDNGSNQRLVVQPATDASSPSGKPCGFVNRAIFDPSKDTSIDVAVVTISDETRRPTKGRFANDHSYKYKEAGFDDLPEYNNAAVLKDIKQYGTSNMVVKFGSETHLTKGHLKVDGAQFRPLSTALGLPSMATELCMNNQYEVIGHRSGIYMFQPGDSGSAVFMLEGTSLHCIGLAIGHTTYGTAVVTPIQAILDALGSDADIEIQRFN